MRCTREGCDGELVEKRSRRGKPFWGCNRYPKCTVTLNARPVPRPCPQCGAVFVLEKKSVRRGTEWVCATEGCAYRAPAASD
ncbi:MAG: topoisomerase DNA-binding C4 zinc finger domain-containing protein [Thermoanaerobaculaceae bacterium]